MVRAPINAVESRPHLSDDDPGMIAAIDRKKLE
jgi:hypothetical protein